MAKELTKTLHTILDSSKGDYIYIGDLIEALNSRGFGSMLVAISLITILPTGAIPGVPAICGALIIFISVQIAWGKKYPWIPSRLKKKKFNCEKYRQGVEKTRPYTEWIDNFFHPRFEALTRKFAQRVIALFSIILATGMIAIGFIPFLPAAFGVVILIFGLGISVHDGLITALGFILMSLLFFLLPGLLL